MDRRDFLKSTSAAALAVGSATVAAAHAAKAADDAQAMAAPSVVPKRRELRMVSLWPDAVMGPGDHVRRFAKRIEAATEHRWVIEIADAPAVGADAFKAVMTGEADLYVGHEHAHRELHPAFSYFAGLPCRTGMDVDQLNAWLVAAGGQELWDELAGEFNMKGLVIGHSGRAHGLWTRHPVRATTDLKNRRIRTVGLAVDILLAIGAEATETTPASSPDNLAMGHIDGTEVIGAGELTALAHTFSSRERSTVHTTLAINNTGYGISLGLRRSVWDGFAESERVILAALASEARTAGSAETRTEEAATAHMYEAASQFVTFVGSQRYIDLARPLTRIAETIVADVAGHDEHSRRINASYMAFKGPRPTGVIA